MQEKVRGSGAGGGPLGSGRGKPPISVTILGAGDAFASKGRFQAGYVIKSSNLQILMEAGPSLLASMKRIPIAPADIDVVLISHLHGDHFAGLPFLILEYLYESPRGRRLTIAGPPLLEQRTWTLFRNMFPETDASAVSHLLDFVELAPDQSVQLAKTLHVQSINVPHQKEHLSLAYRITLEGKVIAFSGDTGWDDGLIRLSAGSDLFLCECTYFDKPELNFHISYAHFMTQHHRFSARRLMLTHIGREVLDRLSEVRLETASDGMTIEI